MNPEARQLFEKLIQIEPQMRFELLAKTAAEAVKFYIQRDSIALLKIAIEAERASGRERRAAGLQTSFVSELDARATAEMLDMLEAYCAAMELLLPAAEKFASPAKEKPDAEEKA